MHQPMDGVPVKVEEQIDVELDVSGDGGEEVVDVAGEPNYSSERPRRSRRTNPRYASEGDGYGQSGEVFNRLDGDVELDIQDSMEVCKESQVVQRGYRNAKTEYGDYGLVEFKFDSTQRKRHVIVYNSRKYPGRASEWYFARSNGTTENETYRCVQCRRHREEIKRGLRTDKFSRPEARIIVHLDRFLTDPDEPLGEHICDFENNEKTLLHHVWSKRALSKANSELRLNPIKPKSKFNSLLEEVRSGPEYAHLPEDVREKIIDELCNSRKGFNSRRRSFARNNRFAQTHNNRKVEMDDDYDIERPHEVMHFICGMPRCSARFTNEALRAKHRSYAHPGVFFIDSNEDLKSYHDMTRMNPNVIPGEELIVADEQEVSADPRSYHSGHDVPTYEIIRADTREPLDDDQQRYLDQVDLLLGSIREHAVACLNDPQRRDQAVNQLNELHVYFEGLNQVENATEGQVQVHEEK